MAHFMSRNPLASSVSSMDTRALDPPSSPTALTSAPGGGSTKASHRFMRNLLRPSVSAAALRSATGSPGGNEMPLSPRTPTANGIPSTGVAVSTPPTPTANSSSFRMRSTTWDHTPTGSPSESQTQYPSGSERDNSSTGPSSPSPYTNGFSRDPNSRPPASSAMMAPSLSSGSTASVRGRQRQTSGVSNGSSSGGMGRPVPGIMPAPRERRPKGELQQQQALPDTHGVTTVQMFPRGRV